VEYDDSSLNPQAGCFATAWINSDGSLSWTGHTFPFDSIYASGLTTVVDYVIVPVYVTGVEDNYWEIFD
jgi:hypothetical protein